MSDNLLNLVVKFSTLDGLSGSLKSMIGLGRSSKDEMRGLTSELAKVKKGIKDYDAELKVATGSVNHLWNAQKKLLQQEEELRARIERRRRLDAIDGRTARIQSQAATYRQEGMMGLASAAMTAVPFFAAIKEARDYETELARIDSLGLGKGVVRQADRFAHSAQIIGNSTRDMAAAYGDAMAIFKDTHEADFATPLIAKMKFANQALFGAEAGGEHDQALMSLMKTIEFRGGTKSEAAFGQQADFAQKVVNASRGRVNGNEMLLAMKVGGILAKTMSDKAFYLNSEPFLQEMSGNRFGNSLSAVYSNLAQGHGSIASQQELMRLGLLDPKKVEFNKLGMVKKTLPGAADISVLREEGVLAYLNKVLLPAFAKKGITGDQAIFDEIGRIFSNRNAANLFATAYQQRDKLAMQSAANARALGIEGSVKVASGTFAGKSVDLSAKWHSFLEVAAKKGGLLDMAILGVGKLTDALDGLTSFGNRHPTMFKWIGMALTGMLGLRVGIAVAKLAFGGFLGPVAQVWGLLSKFRLLGGATAALGPVFRGVGAALRWVGMGARLILPFIMAIPVSWMLIGVAIGLAAVLVWKHWDKIKAAFWGGVAAVKHAIGGLPDWMKSLGRMMMDGLLAALDTGRLKAHMVDLAHQGATAFKDFFGIKSPSRLMMEMGGHIATGLGMGMDNHAHRPKGAMKRMAAAVAGAGVLTMAPAAGAAASAAPRGAAKIEIHIHQLPGEDADALAQRVMEKIVRAQRANGLATFQDDF